MSRDKPSVLDVLMEAYDKSNGETTDIVIDHEELRGVTPEMLDWWKLNVSRSDNYRKWYPQDHVAFILEAPLGKQANAAPTIVVVESFGKYAPSALRIHPQDRPGWDAYTDCDGRRVAWLHEEVEFTPGGVKMHSIMRCPAKTPKAFIRAVREHCIAEVQRFAEVLPEMYKKAAKAT